MDNIRKFKLIQRYSLALKICALIAAVAIMMMVVS